MAPPKDSPATTSVVVDATGFVSATVVPDGGAVVVVTGGSFGGSTLTSSVVDVESLLSSLLHAGPTTTSRAAIVTAVTRPIDRNFDRSHMLAGSMTFTLRVRPPGMADMAPPS